MSPLYTDIAAIVLAAGKGTRMKSDKAKVLHHLDGHPMIRYVIETALKVVGHNIVVVVGHQAEAVRQTVAEAAEVLFAHQEVQLGTGHAVKCALPCVPTEIENIIILCGDVPLITDKTLKTLVHTHLHANNIITLLGVQLDNPTGYGRLITDDSGNVKKIVEEADATEIERRITTINSGVYCIQREFLNGAINRLNSDNAQNEIYLTDLIEVAVDSGLSVGMNLVSEYTEMLGVNTLEDLERVEAVLKLRGKSLDFGISEIL
jgi:UDP-N-acetylglucosamine diphosphorylase/glucosamine-1-phosphate N-acetyltransferase